MKTVWLELSGPASRLRLFTIDGQDLFLSVGQDIAGLIKLDQKGRRALQKALEEFEGATGRNEGTGHQEAYQRPSQEGKTLDDIPKTRTRTKA